MITQQKVFQIIQTCIDSSSPINENSSMDNVEGWDSLTHLKILNTLDQELNGKLMDVDEMADAISAKEIIQVLNKHKFLAK